MTESWEVIEARLKESTANLSDEVREKVWALSKEAHERSLRADREGWSKARRLQEMLLRHDSPAWDPTGERWLLPPSMEKQASAFEPSERDLYNREWIEKHHREAS